MIMIHVSDVSHVEIKKVGFLKNKAGDRTHDLCDIKFLFRKNPKITKFRERTNIRFMIIAF